MKKSYLMMAAAATMFAACTQSDFVNNVPETEQEIGFDNHVGKSTRAEIIDEAALAGEGGFVVWGWKTLTTTPDWASATNIFNGVNVFAPEVAGAAGAATTLTYTLKKYWDKTSTYNFYAVAPYNPTSGSYSIDGAENGYITITGAKSDFAKTSDDFLIDRDGNKNVNGAGNDDGTHNKVNFDFNHVMAKVSIKLQRNIAENITVNSITMTGWNGKNGIFTQKLNNTPTTTTDITEWSFVTGDAVAGIVTFNQGYALTTDAAVAVEDSYIMVPQHVGTLIFTLNYTITYSDDTEENFVAHVGELEDQTWGTDSWTTYTIKVGPQPIEFDVTSVSGFTNKPETQPELPID